MNKKSRRNFLKSAAGITGAGLFGVPALATSIYDNTIKLAHAELITRELGNTGIRIPVVSMGVMNANNPNLLKAAWNSGMRHFDTAWYYQGGNNEKMIGAVLKELNIERDDVTIATKVPLFGQDNKGEGNDRKKLFLSRFEESLTRLQMDYVDILYYHMPENLEQINNPYILEAFNELKEQKKIRFKGFSSHTYWPDLLDDAVERGFYEVILLSFNYSMSHDTRTYEAMKKAHAAGIGMVAMKTQCQQDWYKQNLPAETQKYYEGKIMHTALLKWVLRHDFITTAIPGFTTFQQLEEDMTVAYNLDYTEDEKLFLTDQKVDLAIQEVCRHCGQCTGNCPKNTDIPSLMRTHMYAYAYGNSLMASQTLSQIDRGRGIDNCENCDECIAKCINRVPVASRVSELKTLYC